MPQEAEQIEQRLRDVAVGLLTPFKGNLEIDHRKIEENAQSHSDAETCTFLAAANSSEFREPIRPLTSGEADRTEEIYTNLDDDIIRLIA